MKARPRVIGPPRTRPASATRAPRARGRTPLPPRRRRRSRRSVRTRDAAACQSDCTKRVNAAATRSWKSAPARSILSAWPRACARTLRTAASSANTSVTSGTRPPVASAFAVRTASKGRPRPCTWYAYVERKKRSASTTSPRASAGRITRSTSSARDAMKSIASARGVRSACFGSSSQRRMSSPSGVPPGSRTVVWATSLCVSHTSSRASWVVLPAPSGASNTMSRPGALLTPV